MRAKKGPEKRMGPQQGKLEGDRENRSNKREKLLFSTFPYKIEIEFSSVLLSAGI